jgi:hypothetical protein
MIITSHIVAGAASGSVASNLWVAFLYGFISHFILDYIPHTDISSFLPKRNKQGFDSSPYFKNIKLILLDALISLILIIVLLIFAQGKSWLIIIGAFGGILPDLLDNNPFVTPYLRRNYFFKKYFHEMIHHRIHYSVRREQGWGWLILGMVTQLVIIGGGLCILF